MASVSGYTLMCYRCVYSPGMCVCTKIYPTSGLWMKTLAPSVLSAIAMPETCTGCCRSSLIGLVMNIKFVSLVHTFLKLTNVVSGEKKRRQTE